MKIVTKSSINERVWTYRWSMIEVATGGLLLGGAGTIDTDYAAIRTEAQNELGWLFESYGNPGDMLDAFPDEEPTAQQRIEFNGWASQQPDRPVRVAVVLYFY